MQNIQIIISLAGTTFGFIATTATLLLKFIKSSKAKKAAEQVIKITNEIVPYIEQAETFMNYSGVEKKEFVMTKANQFAITYGLFFDATAVSDKIEELVQLSKTVNNCNKNSGNDLSQNGHNKTIQSQQFYSNSNIPVNNNRTIDRMDILNQNNNF